MRRKHKGIFHTTIDMTDAEIGSLLVVERADANPNHAGANWRCVCRCGRFCEVLGTTLRQHAKLKRDISCGCKRHQNAVQRGKAMGTIQGPLNAKSGFMAKVARLPQTREAARQRGLEMRDSGELAHLASLGATARNHNQYHVLRHQTKSACRLCTNG